MDLFELTLLFISGMAGGALNVTVGGGWFIVFPSLTYFGRQPVSGNAMTTTTLWSAHISSIINKKSNLFTIKKYKIYAGVISSIGGLCGALLLVIFSHETFEIIGPYLLLFSWIMFTFNKNILSYFDSKEEKPFEFLGNRLISFFLVNVYGSYFGAGVGMMFVALLRFYGLKDEREINAIKDYMIAVNNGVAILVFVISGLIHWSFVVALVSGSVIGGYYGAKISKRIDVVIIKRVMVVIGALVTLYFLKIIQL